jgi:hypothetical protein
VCKITTRNKNGTSINNAEDKKPLWCIHAKECVQKTLQLLPLEDMILDKNSVAYAACFCILPIRDVTAAVH